MTVGRSSRLRLAPLRSASLATNNKLKMFIFSNDGFNLNKMCKVPFSSKVQMETVS